MRAKGRYQALYEWQGFNPLKTFDSSGKIWSSGTTRIALPDDQVAGDFVANSKLPSAAAMPLP